MTELIADGESGWVAPDGTAAGLASALRRVLDTPAARRAAMGRNAEAAVRRICSNEAVLQLHLDWRKRVTDAGASRSYSVPTPIAAETSLQALPQGSPQPQGGTVPRGMAVVVTCLRRPDLLPGCLKNIGQQTQTASLVIVAGDARSRTTGSHPDVEFLEATSAAAARNVGLQRVLQSASPVRGIVFLNEGVRLAPEYLKITESVLERQTGVGSVTSFLRYEGERDGRIETPGPGSPWSLGELDAMPCAAVRVEALQSCEHSSTAWTPVTYPDTMATIVGTPVSETLAEGRHRKRYSAMALAQHGSAQFTLQWFLAAPWTEKARWAGRVLTRPRRTANWLAWHFRAAAARAR